MQTVNKSAGDDYSARVQLNPQMPVAWTRGWLLTAQVYTTVPGSLNGFNIIQKSKATSESQNRLSTVSLYKLKTLPTSLFNGMKYTFLFQKRGTGYSKEKQGQSKNKTHQDKLQIPCAMSGIWSSD